MSDKIKDTEEMNENKEITAEDLDGVAGGRAPVYKKKPDNCIDSRLLRMAYGAPDLGLRSLSPEVVKKLEKSLEKYTIDKNISILGFTQDMNDILSAVDIIVSKPGGLTTTECLLKELPMIIPYYIPGQEEENMDFLSNCGAALRTSKKFTISVLLKVLIDNPTRMKLLKNNIKSIKKQNTAEDIANLVSNILGY